MFLIKAGTVITVYAPFNKVNGPMQSATATATYIDHAPWKPYTTKEDRFYDKHEVYDAFRMSQHDDTPMWVTTHIRNGKVVVCRDGKWASLPATAIEYVG